MQKLNQSAHLATHALLINSGIRIRTFPLKEPLLNKLCATGPHHHFRQLQQTFLRGYLDDVAGLRAPAAPR